MSAGPSWKETIAGLDRRLADAFGRIDAGLSEPRARLERRPAGGGWSALETAEHVALADHHLLILVEKIAARCRMRSDAIAPEPPSFERLARIASREFRWESPGHMLPAGSATPSELRACLREQAARCRSLLAAMPRGEGSRHRIAMSVVGERLDLYQYLAVIALHAERHADQMRRALHPS